MSDVIFLVSVTKTQDEKDVWRETTETRRVFCRADSITQREFFEAGRNGLNPEMKFTVFAGDYNGERTVEFHGNGFGVYRTFESGDIVELYCERKGGTNGQ